MIRLIAVSLVVLVLASCTAQDVKFAPQDQVEAARYVHPGPPAVTLFTVVSTRSGAGAHAGLLINGSERVMFDPAGTWYHPRLPERNDMHFGMTPKAVDFYLDYHARETYDVIEQTVVVPLAVAELVMARARDYGAVPKGQCARSLSSILAGVPGFESLPRTWSPRKLSAAFGALPGVTTRTITDDDTNDNHGVLLVQAQQAPDAGR